jgi:hypothetical protein
MQIVERRSPLVGLRIGKSDRQAPKLDRVGRSRIVLDAEPVAGEKAVACFPHGKSVRISGIGYKRVHTLLSLDPKLSQVMKRVPLSSGREPASYHPEEFVDGSQPWPRLLALKDGELLAKGEVFEHQTAVRPKHEKHGSEPEPKQGNMATKL